MNEDKHHKKGYSRALTPTLILIIKTYDWPYA